MLQKNCMIKTQCEHMTLYEHNIMKKTVLFTKVVNQLVNNVVFHFVVFRLCVFTYDIFIFLLL